MISLALKFLVSMKGRQPFGTRCRAILQPIPARYLRMGPFERNGEWCESPTCRIARTGEIQLGRHGPTAWAKPTALSNLHRWRVAHRLVNGVIFWRNVKVVKPGFEILSQLISQRFHARILHLRFSLIRNYPTALT